MQQTATIDEPRGGHHTLVAKPPEGPGAQGGFDVLPDPRLSPGKGRALVIGNSAYEHRPKLPGAAKDVALVRALLESPESWSIGGTRIEAHADLPANGTKDRPSLRAAVQGFFAKAEPDETLFFYFSGHGESDATQGYLLPVDAPENGRTGAISVTDLWSFVRASKAGRIVVLVDACRAGRFVVPVDLQLQGRVAVLAATEPAGAARDFTSGGAFTRALLGAPARPEAFDPDMRAVTLLKAFYVAANDVSAQAPMLYGMGEILRLPLAWPPPKKVDRRAATDVRSDGKTGLRSARADLVAATDRGTGATIRERNGKLEVVVVFEEVTEAVKLSGYQPKEGYDAKPRPAARPQRFPKAPAGTWPEGKEVTLPLWDVKTDKDGLIELRTCTAAGACGLPKLLALPSPK